MNIIRGNYWSALCLAVVLSIGENRLVAVGTLIPVADRVDMVHDPGRDVLYISSGSTILRYHLGSDSFLSPIQLSGTLGLLDLSPDANTVAVTDANRSSSNVWIHLVDLFSASGNRVFFTRDYGEGGTYCVAFGNDNALLISSTYEGSGSVSLRRYEIATGANRVLGSIMQNSIL